ncbi:hypothetical protein [Streptomyces sp. 2A115]|uniref:hypothetical protein n=1 Tax=Streptomyces sp. 2A115 TaxID=3457439 RepID=UPI003FD56395
MTHNGQGDEPSARPAREGIVLPSDGGEPLLPGQTGDRAVPAGGQAWGQPWGPGPAPQAPQEPGQGWTPTGEWGNAGPDRPDHGAQAPGWDQAASGQGAPGAGSGAQDSGWGAQGGAAEGAPGWGANGPTSQYADQTSQYRAQDAGPQWDGRQSPNGGGGLPRSRTDGAGTPPQQPGGGTPLSHEGAGTNGYGTPQTQGTYGTPQTQAAYGAPQPAAPQAPAGQADPLPPAARHAAPQAPAQAQGGSAESQGSGGGYGFPHAAAAAPPPSGAYDASQAPGGRAAPLPPADAGAGSLPPAAPMDEGATQYLPPVAAAAPADEGVTQYIPPVGPGALPPEMSSGSPSQAMPSPATPSEATQYLGWVPQDRPGPMPGGGGAGPMPPVADPDAQATQFIAPVPAQPGAAPYGIRPGGPEGRQQPPAEFDNLFRADAAGSTQQLPRFEQPRARQGGAPGYGTPGHPGTPGAPGSPDGPAGRGTRRGATDGDNGRGGGGRGGRTRSRVPLVAAVGVGIAVLGIGAGALLSAGGGGDDDKDDESKPVAATAPATDGSASPSADPAKEQAVALDKLLADSNDSRDSVIKAVTNVRACTDLGAAATDLRNAAKQRNGLVTRLAALPVDKLPNQAQLTAALNSAWKASAAADTHYAAWADQVAGKKGCPKGKARTTGQTQAGNRESGTATTEKAKAAKLWNSIAQTYGLTERQPNQL